MSQSWLLLLALAPGAAGPESVLDSARQIVSIDIGVPQENLALPGPSYRCWKLRLSTERGLAAHLIQKKLKEMQGGISRRLGELDETPSEAASAEMRAEIAGLVSDFQKLQDDSLRRSLIRRLDPVELLGRQVAAERLVANVSGGDYRMERDDSGPGCRPGETAPPPSG